MLFEPQFRLKYNSMKGVKERRYIWIFFIYVTHKALHSGTFKYYFKLISFNYQPNNNTGIISLLYSFGGAWGSKDN